MQNEFLEYLNKTSLEKRDKSYIKSIFNYFKGESPQIFANRVFLFEGEPGIGKTFLAKRLINSLNLPTVYFGQSKLDNPNVVSVKSMDNLFKKLKNFENGVVYLDDLKFIFDFNEEGFDLDNKHRKLLMNLIEFFRDNNNQTILIMTTNDSNYFEESLKDRIDVKISFGLPSETDKSSFLNEMFKDYVDSESLSYLAKNSLGYNYRDLPNVIKLAYFHGNEKITKKAIISSLKEYVPSGLLNFKVKQGIEFNLDDLYLEEDVKSKLKKIVTIVRKRKELSEFGVSKSNLFIFEGPAGVGKTHCATALAGELGIPLLKIGSREIYNPGLFGKLFLNIRRFGNSVILIDDADKVIDGNSLGYDDGGTLFADLNKQLDELDETGGIVILSANNAKRFGIALRNRFELIEFGMPSLNQRRQFFIDLFKKSKIKNDFNIDVLVSYTNGKNFRDMQRAWNECMFYMVENEINDFTEKDFTQIFKNNQNNFSKLSMIG
jgi:AAA+ superfamily predicted ATPase